MGGTGSGTSQATPRQAQILASQLDALAYLARAREHAREGDEALRMAEGLLRRANGGCVREFYPRDSLQDLVGAA